MRRFHEIITAHEEVATKQWALWLGVATNTVSTHWRNGGGGPSWDSVVSAWPKLPPAIQDELLALLPREVEPAEQGVPGAVLEASGLVVQLLRAAVAFGQLGPVDHLARAEGAAEIAAKVETIIRVLRSAAASASATPPGRGGRS